MVPTRNLLHHDKGSNKQYYCIAAQLESSSHNDHKPAPPPRQPWLAMADDEAAAGTSSRGGGGGGGGGGDDKDWLQLGLGAMASSSSTSSSGDTTTTPAPMELDSFADKNPRPRPPLFPLPIRSYQHGLRYRPPAAVGSTSAAPFSPFARPLRSSGDAMRVISPPRRMDAGLWLALQAAPNQIREPILPQIPKSYLRIKDSNMKVEVLMKYLADKLGLTESQVELTCRGQLLPPFLLVKYVRDSLWCSALLREEEDVIVELPARHSPATTDHVMTLLYSTSRSYP